jgi:diacylglycerol kinase (ATP)
VDGSPIALPRDSAGQPPVLLLRNPTAGRGRSGAAFEALTQRLVAAGRAVAVAAGEDADAAVDRLRSLLGDGAAAVVAVGGDGTVHQALQAVAGTGVPLGIIPAGTGNDIARALGLPQSPAAAADAVAEALRTGRSRPVDLGRVTLTDGTVRWFAGVLGAGFDTVVNERANRMGFPRGPRRYDVAIFAELLRLRPRRYALELDGTVHDVEAVLVAVGNTCSYGGGFRICPAADPADGLLDVVVGGRFTRRGLVGILPHVRRGTHLGRPMVSAYRARKVTLAAEGITGYADGERLGPLPLTVECVPGALTLLGEPL